MRKECQTCFSRSPSMQTERKTHNLVLKRVKKKITTWSFLIAHYCYFLGAVIAVLSRVMLFTLYLSGHFIWWSRLVKGHNPFTLSSVSQRGKIIFVDRPESVNCSPSAISIYTFVFIKGPYVLLPNTLQKWPQPTSQALNNQFHFTLQHFYFSLLLAARCWGNAHCCRMAKWLIKKRLCWVLRPKHSQDIFSHAPVCVKVTMALLFRVSWTEWWAMWSAKTNCQVTAFA